MKTFKTTLGNDALIELIYLDPSIPVIGEEPIATINEEHFNTWAIFDIRNAMMSYMDIQLFIHSISFSIDDIEELCTFITKCEKELIKEYNENKIIIEKED